MLNWISSSEQHYRPHCIYRVFGRYLAVGGYMRIYTPVYPLISKKKRRRTSHAFFPGRHVYRALRAALSGAAVFPLFIRRRATHTAQFAAA